MARCRRRNFAAVTAIISALAAWSCDRSIAQGNVSISIFRALGRTRLILRLAIKRRWSCSWRCSAACLRTTTPRDRNKLRSPCLYGFRWRGTSSQTLLKVELLAALNSVGVTEPSSNEAVSGSSYQRFHQSCSCFGRRQFIGGYRGAIIQKVRCGVEPIGGCGAVAVQ